MKLEDIGKDPASYVQQTRGDVSGAAQEASKETVANKLTMSMQSARLAAKRIVDSQRQSAIEDSGELATQRCLKMSDFKTDHTTKIDNVKTRSTIEAYRSNYEQDYSDWETDLRTREKTPNAQQWQVLNLVHARCVYEHNEEKQHCVNATPEPRSWEPLFRLVHGLPGSGKSQLFKWVKEYFELVWQWELGVHFEYLVPLNSMATAISGKTTFLGRH